MRRPRYHLPLARRARTGPNADTPSGTAPAATFTRSDVTGNTALLQGGGIYNGLRGTLTTTGVSGSPLFIRNNTGSQGGGIAAVSSTATTMTQTAVTVNNAVLAAGGVYRLGGTMTTTDSPITANTPNNCVGRAPAVPNCTHLAQRQCRQGVGGWGRVGGGCRCSG